jgi:hypothetical protein
VISCASQLQGDAKRKNTHIMPDFLEAALRHAAKKHGFTGDHADKYVYGAMQNMHVLKGNLETEKGKEMEAKHQADLKKSPTKHKLRVKRRRDLVELR